MKRSTMLIGACGFIAAFASSVATTITVNAHKKAELALKLDPMLFEHMMKEQGCDAYRPNTDTHECKIARADLLKAFPGAKARFPSLEK